MYICGKEIELHNGKALVCVDTPHTSPTHKMKIFGPTITQEKRVL